ncbi:carboxymuconolactone decarboxylase family protein [Patulibacter americanus]|uniref:carboxymuconolactone decarboxylase family protein n=1 Tax=Patulibacter americanus TaxID=588672 RepID=UPI0003B6D64F|nr:carboxymuconolactone decarboxylase family protein [Patulibacter americanus]
MPRIAPIDPTSADAKAKPLLDAVQAKLGVTPNMMRTMAQSPAVLESYLGFGGALGKGTLGARLGELLALDVAEANGCGYCLSAHTYLGTNVAKLSDEQITAARSADSEDPKTRAALRFARQINDGRGHVTDEQVDAVRAAGWGDAAIAEIVAHVALNVLTNYFNTVAQVEIDFPVVLPAAQRTAA